MMTQQVDHIVVGLGKTGLSVANYLHQKSQDYIVVDNQPNPTQKLALQKINKVDLIEGEFSTALLKKAKILIVNPGIAVETKAIKAAFDSGVKVIGDIELFAKEIKTRAAKVVAVTGSNGKSTVVSLLYQMAKNAGVNVKLGGNIGTPALDLLDDETTELFILELSSFQLETTQSLDCEVSCVLNICPDHLDRYQSYQDYIYAKQRLLSQSQKIVVNADDNIIKDWKINGKQTCFSIKQTDCEYALVDGVIKTKTQILINVDEIKLKGKHNISNALACLAIGEILGIPLNQMLDTLRNFDGLRHRSQFVANINGVTWINDSKATNVGASVAAIESFSENKNIILIAGGQTKGADLSPLKSPCNRLVKSAILFGEDKDLIKVAIANDTKCQLVADLQAAVNLARTISQSGDIVLLAPAGASFDLFENYQARGDAFIDLVGSMQ